jgi:aspartyl-tRNA synthetase
MMRTHRCGDLGLEHEGAAVVLCGWVHSRRDHGGVTFVDLRDAAGLVQVVFNVDSSEQLHSAAQALRSEWCVRVHGTVRRRKAGTENPKLRTGSVEVEASLLEVLSEAETPPFVIGDHVDVDEGLRLKYRYLDLRSDRMQTNLRLRHAIVAEIRRFFDSEGFVEVETPMLTRATPEGARDFLVPSRLHPGAFYALPQSPQLYKQLLMVAGFDRYYQIARCLRDEDLRADRQVDFTQLDMEMSFVEQEDVLQVTERMFKHVWRAVLDVELDDFPRLSFAESMERFGVDKPDLRFGMELTDLGHVFAATDFKVFSHALEGGGAVKGLVLQGRGDLARRELEELVEDAKSLGAKGLVWIGVSTEELRSPVARWLSDEESRALVEAMGARAGDLLLIVADERRSVVLKSLGALRNRLAQRYGLIPARPRHDPDAWRFAWIVDFPWFEWDEQAGRWDFIHHPFTGVVEDTMGYLDSDPGKVLSKSYDITLNGWELASGSIRIHDRATQQRVFGALGISPEEAQAKFGFLLDAFRYGAPPHGGIAPGIDRIVALAAGEANIREVIAFPKTQTAYDPLTGAPAPVDDAQLAAVHIKSTAPPRARE